jgi:hypothetical protein
MTDRGGVPFQQVEKTELAPGVGLGRAAAAERHGDGRRQTSLQRSRGHQRTRGRGAVCAPPGGADLSSGGGCQRRDMWRLDSCQCGEGTVDSNYLMTADLGPCPRLSGVDR